MADVKKCHKPVDVLPDFIPSLLVAWRELVEAMENLAANPHAQSGDFEAARKSLHALPGRVILQPRDGLLWAHLSPKANGLVDTSRSAALHINSQFLVAGA